MPDELIATDLLRIARDPGTGRLVRRNTLAVGVRAALFAELALAGQIVDYGERLTRSAQHRTRTGFSTRSGMRSRPGPGSRGLDGFGTFTATASRWSTSLLLTGCGRQRDGTATSTWTPRACSTALAG